MIIAKRKKQPFLAALIPKPKFYHVHLSMTKMATFKVFKPFLTPEKPFIFIMVFTKYMSIFTSPRLCGISRPLGLFPHVLPEFFRGIKFLSLRHNVGASRVELELTGPKSVVMPLYHTPIFVPSEKLGLLIQPCYQL
jgi:hypothetical protein